MIALGVDCLMDITELEAFCDWVMFAVPLMTAPPVGS